MLGDSFSSLLLSHGHALALEPRAVSLQGDSGVPCCHSWPAGAWTLEQSEGTDPSCSVRENIFTIFRKEVKLCH